MSKGSHIEVPSKDMVRKLRPAFLNVPADSPFDRHLLVWSYGDTFGAAFVPDIPHVLSYRGKSYQVQQRYLGDWDPLLDSAGRLAGISMLLWENEPILRSDFLRRHKQLVTDGGLLQIHLCPDRACETECIQGVGTRSYLNSHGDYMFLFPQWCDWGEVAFPLACSEIPVLR